MGDAIRKHDRRPTKAKAIPPRIRRLAAGDFDREAWLELGRAIATDQGRLAWEAAYWTLYGPERLGNWAFQYLGDGTTDPADDPDAIFPQSGATLDNYRVTARRFPPSIVFQADPDGEPFEDADGDLVAPLRWPDVVWSFTVWQTLTPKDLPDDFVFGVLDAVQASFDARRAWDAQEDHAPDDARPGTLCRADVRRAVKAYRDRRDRESVDADPSTPAPEDPDAGLERATQNVIPFPTGSNPFEDVDQAPRTVAVSFRRVVDARLVADTGRSVVLRGVGPIRTEVRDDDPDAIRVVLDRDAVRDVVLEALDANPNADGLTLANWIADHLDPDDAP